MSRERRRFSSPRSSVCVGVSQKPWRASRLPGVLAGALVAVKLAAVKLCGCSGAASDSFS
jgi:hypothetical protein